MSPRIGRPPIDNPKDNRITIRLDAKQNETLEKCAEYFGVSKAEIFCRGLALIAIEKENSNVQQLFDAIDILYQIIVRKDKFGDDYEENIRGSIRQIKFNFDEFLKELLKKLE